MPCECEDCSCKNCSLNNDHFDEDNEERTYDEILKDLKNLRQELLSKKCPYFKKKCPFFDKLNDKNIDDTEEDIEDELPSSSIKPDKTSECLCSNCNSESYSVWIKIMIYIILFILLYKNFNIFFDIYGSPLIIILLLWFIGVIFYFCKTL